MNVLRWGTKIIENASPAGLILAGTALALTTPPFRRKLRGVAVMATRGVLVATETVQNTALTLREGLEDIVAEAKASSDPLAEDEKNKCTLTTAVKNHGRRLAVTAAAGALAVRDEFNNIVEEAKKESPTNEENTEMNALTESAETKGSNEAEFQATNQPLALSETTAPDHEILEEVEPDIGSTTSLKRRTRSNK
ncbi:MAG: hypothetical protein H6Q71_34 [Firmicutes bacterium]|nr:hypothetical protein [Bacillota bacterium]